MIAKMHLMLHLLSLLVSCILCICELIPCNEACAVNCSMGNRFLVSYFIDVADFEPESPDEFQICETYDQEEVGLFYGFLAWLIFLHLHLSKSS